MFGSMSALVTVDAAAAQLGVSRGHARRLLSPYAVPQGQGVPALYRPDDVQAIKRERASRPACRYCSRRVAGRGRVTCGRQECLRRQRGIVDAGPLPKLSREKLARIVESPDALGRRRVERALVALRGRGVDFNRAVMATATAMNERPAVVLSIAKDKGLAWNR